MYDLQHLTEEAIELLKMLISIPSFSTQENRTATQIEHFLTKHGIPFFRKANNVWARNLQYDPSKPTVLLNSHHDTVKPNSGYKRNPFSAEESDGKLYGLGSNDAGASLVSLLATFLHYFKRADLSFNLIIAATAEEENSGSNGLELLLPELGKLSWAIVGEPTGMQMAVAEKGLMVLDVTVKGKSGHAARSGGDNAIYKALPVVEWFKEFSFPKSSLTLGAVKMTVTAVHSGSEHNVVPDICSLVVDVRLTDSYTHEEVLDVIRQHCNAEILPRSTRLKPSSIALDHPVVQAGIALGLGTFGSPTTSDQALLSVPSVKLGPGESERSHTADEFIFRAEIESGIKKYVELLGAIK